MLIPTIHELSHQPRRPYLHRIEIARQVAERLKHLSDQFGIRETGKIVRHMNGNISRNEACHYAKIAGRAVGPDFGEDSLAVLPKILLNSRQEFLTERVP